LQKKNILGKLISMLIVSPSFGCSSFLSLYFSEISDWVVAVVAFPEFIGIINVEGLIVKTLHCCGRSGNYPVYFY